MSGKFFRIDHSDAIFSNFSRRSYELTLRGGTPYEKGVEVDASIGFKSVLKYSCFHQHRRQIMIGWQRNHHRRIPTNNVARMYSKSIEKHVFVVKVVLSLRRN